MAEAGWDEREWFETLFREHYDAVLRYALARTADADTAKDMAAKTFLVAWRRRTDIPERTLPWLIGVARKTLAEERRSSARRGGLHDRLLAERWADDGSDGGGDPADDVTERAVVLQALAEIPAADRELLQLLAWDNLTPEDAAASLGCSRATFAVRLLRARRRFNAALDRRDRATDLSPVPSTTGVRDDNDQP